MTESYKCDKCKEFRIGKPTTTISCVYRNNRCDLCIDCNKKLEKWLKLEKRERMKQHLLEREYNMGWGK